MEKYNDILPALTLAVGREYTLTPTMGGILVPEWDPMDSNDDAAELEMWMVEQGWAVTIEHDQDVGYKHHWCEVTFADWSTRQRQHSSFVDNGDESDPLRRRRRALVEAAWEALQEDPSREDNT